MSAPFTTQGQAIRLPLRILHLEDSEFDAELVAASLESAGLECEIQRVDTQDAFVSALENCGIDIILADYALPAFDGVTALKLATDMCPDIPYIFVSGKMGEDVAVESLKQGATDYVLKNHLKRLVPAVGRALNEVYDRAERRKAEKALWESEARIQRLESLRVLAGGIAHDLNNLMVGVDANAGLALRALPPGSPAAAMIRGIEAAVDKVTLFSKQIMNFTGKFELVREPVQLNETVKDTSHFLLASISKKATLEYSLEDYLPVILADPQNVQQVVMNLILNASDALGDSKGIIKVSTGKVNGDRSYLDSLNLGVMLPEGEYVYVEVSDNGCGMDEKTRGRIFDPFYTTKFTGRGLGLSAVFGIVKGHGGAIGLDSEPGCGATFKVLLPVPPEPVAMKTEKQESEGVWTGYGTVLVVDDDDGALTLTQRVLETANYEVLTATDGPEGIEVFMKNKDSISLVIIDLIMPLMRGDEAVRAMRKEKENIKVRFLSGYSDKELGELALQQENITIMTKPYKVTKLLEKVQDVLTA